jgi:hypothetical protein
MKTLVLFLIVLSFNLSLSAQDTWNDYVIGRPMAGHYDAKKVIAKEWGINYQVTFAGCVLSDEISEKATSYQASNKIYFETLAAKYGQNWQQDFELDVKKEMHRNSNREKGNWYEIIESHTNKDFFTSKKEVAKTWGIAYQALFVTKNTTASEQIEFMDFLVVNEDYMRQLKNTFGPNWQKTLNQEVDLELEKQTVASPDNVWIEYVVGRPNMAHFEAKKEVAKEWGINYEVQFKNCTLSDELKQEMSEIEAKNAPYFKILEKNYGKDWTLRFNQAIEKKIATGKLDKK